MNGTDGNADLVRRFPEHLRRLGVPEPGAHVVVALSGGLDSVVLLHLLRFTRGLPPLELSAAHLDHATRTSSGGDADWCRGLARAWGVPLAVERLPSPPANEAEARRWRYDFLEGIRANRRAGWVATAHHADDQAETVLFRVLRGTGVEGLAGIDPVRRRARLLRPLLPFWREDLEGYALEHGLSWRRDPTNRSLRHARNVLRLEVLPRVEEAVAPGARRSLVRLARLARHDRDGWRALLGPVLEDVVQETAGDRIVVVRSRLLAYHSEVRRRALRTLARRLGGGLDEAGTRGGMQFTSSGASGQRVFLTGGMVLRRDFDRLVLLAPGAPDEGSAGRSAAGAEEPSYLEIDGPGDGGGCLELGHRQWDVCWRSGGRPAGRWVASFPTDRLDFPLRLRGWRPGDRMRLPYGSKKLSRLYAEARVPVAERRVRPLLQDRGGRILWVPGVARVPEVDPAERTAGGQTFTIAIDDADED